MRMSKLPVLHFTEGPARLTIYKAFRFNRSRVPESGLALASRLWAVARQSR